MRDGNLIGSALLRMLNGKRSAWLSETEGSASSRSEVIQDGEKGKAGGCVHGDESLRARGSACESRWFPVEQEDQLFIHSHYDVHQYLPYSGVLNMNEENAKNPHHHTASLPTHRHHPRTDSLSPATGSHTPPSSPAQACGAPPSSTATYASKTPSKAPAASDPPA